MNWITLSAETPGVVRDEHGVPIEWTLLKIGDNPLCQEGRDGCLRLSAEDMRSIVDYHEKKGEDIPIDSEHYLFELAESKKLDEAETVRLFPGGVAALGYGSLALKGEELRIRVKWTPAAYEMLKEKIYKYFSPVIRGLETGPLRVTSVAMTNTPAINHLDALAARAENHQPSGVPDRKEPGMGQLETSEEEKDKLACEVEEKADLIAQVRALLGLPEDATVDTIVAALKAEAEKAKTADEKQAELDNLAASAEKDAHARLVEKGRAEGKITDADTEYVNSLDSKALSAHLAHCPVKIPAKVQIPATRAGSPADAVALTAEDKAACRRLRISEEEFLKAKKERSL